MEDDGRRPRTTTSEGLPDVPREILWDYPEPPLDLMWRLQRIADFFPRHGRDPATLGLLAKHGRELRIPPEIHWLIEIYWEEWNNRGSTRTRS